MYFNRNAPRGAGFSQPLRAPFGQNQRPPFNQPPDAGPRPPAPGAPAAAGGGGGGGGGNLIVLTTVPEDGSQPQVQPGFQGQGQPAFSGPNFRGQQFPFRGGRGGRGGMAGGAGQEEPPLESSATPFLARPQDKYCPSATPAAVAQEAEPARRKKKGLLLHSFALF